MSAFAPTGKAFRLIFRGPSIGLAEIAWRLSFALAAWFLCGAFLFEYANTLPVDAVDRLLLGTRQPELVLRALQRIFHGSGFRFTQSGVLLFLAIVSAWVVLASVGRAATMKAMVEEFRIGAADSRTNISPMLALNVFRIAAMLSGGIAAVGSTLIVSSVWASTHISVATAVRWWLFSLFLVWLVLVILNWLFATASVFVVAEAFDAVEAIAKTIGWLRDHFWSVVAASIWFGMAHAILFVIMWSTAFTVLGLAQLLGLGWTLLIAFAILAIYCAIADFLYVGRLAAYLWIWISPEDELDVQTQAKKPLGKPGGFAIDQNELILSDVPLSAR